MYFKALTMTTDCDKLTIDYDSDNDKSNWQGFQKGIQNWLNAKIILYMLIKRIFVKLYN